MTTSLLKIKSLSNLAIQLVLPAAFISLTSCSLINKKDASYSYIPLHPVKESRIHEGPGKFPDPAGVWKVANEETENVIYLAGTSHALHKKDMPLPSPYYAAYHASDVVVQEMTESGLGFLATFKMIKFAKDNAHKFKGEKGVTESLLEPETKAILKERYKDKYEKLVSRSPFMLYMQINLTEMMGDSDEVGGTKELSDRGGVEDVFEELAQRDSKRLKALDDQSIADIALETIEVMLKEFQKQMKEEGLDKIIRESLVGSDEETLEIYYRKGDRAKMKKEDLMLREMFGDLYEPLIIDRNHKWTVKIEKMLAKRSKAIEYVMVGAAHLEGEDGLLVLLEEKGYKVTQLYGVDRPNQVGGGLK